MVLSTFAFVSCFFAFCHLESETSDINLYINFQHAGLPVVLQRTDSWSYKGAKSNAMVHLMFLINVSTVFYQDAPTGGEVGQDARRSSQSGRSDEVNIFLILFVKKNAKLFLMS